MIDKIGAGIFILNNAKKKITIYTSKGIDENNFFITLLTDNFCSLLTTLEAIAKVPPNPINAFPTSNIHK